MICPLCDDELRPSQVGRITVDVCRGCAATWFDRTELAGVLSVAAPGVAVEWGTPNATDQPGPPCPRDGTRLTPYRWATTEFSRCRSCQGMLLSAAAWHHLLEQAAREEQQVKPSGLLGVGELVMEAQFSLDFS